MKSLYLWEHQGLPTGHTRSGFREVHINHCVDTLVQALHCSGNVNLITTHWANTKFFSFADTGVDPECIDFSSLTQWHKKNTMDINTWLSTCYDPASCRSQEQANTTRHELGTSTDRQDFLYNLTKE
ncbi:hypothetical protein BD289DRAFT_489379 [Coniella lustricola]|uniref:Uncharacterized protein n=1 Tax=Coniella lustricola TaxID=2025994 RepID=A0A2T3A247_9PEZI|nr:hypothetical protein BD289DRAFT_489379 [Coniella lustricola]